MADKLQRMLAILESDKEYSEEYDRFVRSVSYTVEGAAPNFTNAMQAVRALVDKIQ